MQEKILKAMSKQKLMSTWNIANAIDMRGKTAKVLVVMKKMEIYALVEKDYQSTPNNYVWALVPKIKTLEG